MNKNPLSKFIFILGMFMVALTMLLLVGYMFLPVILIKAIPIVIAILLGLLLLLSIFQMFMSKQIIVKLATLPMLLSFFLVGFFLIKLPIYPMLMGAMTGAAYDVDSDALFENMRIGFDIFQIGIWISVIPLVIAALVLTKKSSSKTPKNIDEYYPRKAKVISCESSDVKINNVPLYQLVLEIQDYEDIYCVTKDIRAINYEILTHQAGDMIEVLVDPDKKKKILIESNGMYI